MNKLDINVLFQGIPFLCVQKSNQENSLVISSYNLLFCLKFLKDHINLQFSILSYISAVDLIQNSYRFLLVYDLLSLKYNTRLKLKFFLKEYQVVNSINKTFINANWWEREIWDLFGIFFRNHTDLRRILTDYTFEGFPLRKDFPLSGYMEVKYEFIQKRVTYCKLQLSQEYRKFYIESPIKHIY